MKKVLKVLAGALATALALFAAMALYYTFAPKFMAIAADVNSVCNTDTVSAFYNKVEQDTGFTVMDLSEDTPGDIQVSKAKGEWLCICQLNIEGDRVVKNDDAFCVD